MAGLLSISHPINNVSNGLIDVLVHPPEQKSYLNENKP